MLHAFEAVPFVVAALLSVRQHKFGYILGAVSGAFWLWMAGMLTTFVRNGFERVAMLLRTGHVDRPDIFDRGAGRLRDGRTAVVLAIGLFPRSKPIVDDLGVFAGALALVAGFFVAIFAAFAPQYLRMFGGIFG